MPFSNNSKAEGEASARGFLKGVWITVSEDLGCIWRSRAGVDGPAWSWIRGIGLVKSNLVLRPGGTEAV